MIRCDLIIGYWNSSDINNNVLCVISLFPEVLSVMIPWYRPHDILGQDSVSARCIMCHDLIWNILPIVHESNWGSNHLSIVHHGSSHEYHNYMY